MEIKKSISVVAIAFAAACSQQNERSSAESGEAEGDNPGSATDLATNAIVRDTNALNKADVGLGGPVDREVESLSEKTVPMEANDKELEKAVRVALTTGSTGTTGVIAEDQLTKIQVEARNGVVTLAGPVTSEEEKRIIEKQVSDMPGVNSVVNNLMVLPGQRSDTPLQPLYPRTPGNE